MWIFSKCARIHSTLQGKETSQKDDEVTLFDFQKIFVLVVNLWTNWICAFCANRWTQDQTLSKSTSSVWIQGPGQALEHNYIDFVHQLAVFFPSVQILCVVLALISLFASLPLFSFENVTALYTVLQAELSCTSKLPRFRAKLHLEVAKSFAV